MLAVGLGNGLGPGKAQIVPPPWVVRESSGLGSDRQLNLRGCQICESVLHSLRSLFLAAAMSMACSAVAETQLTVEGGPPELREALVSASILHAGFDPTTPISDQIAAARAEYGRLLAVLYEQGYFSGTISIRIDGREAAQISPFAPPPRIDAIGIRIDPGTAFVLGDVSIGPLAPNAAPPPGFQRGAPASTGVLRDAARDAISDWRADGHAVAQVADQAIVARNRDAELDASIVIDPGPQLRFGTLRPEGTERMPDARAAEIAGLPVGEVFDPDALDRAANRLRRTGVFSSVALTEAPPNADGTIDIVADLVEAPLRRLGFGAELSSSEGLLLSSYWLHRNLTGGGERLRFDGEISGIGQDAGGPDATLGVSFSRPATATPDTTFMASLSAEYLDEETFQELVFEGQAGIEQQISDSLVGQIALGFRFSEISDNFGDRQTTLVTLPSGLTYDTRSDALDATDGLFADLDLTPFVVTGNGEFGASASLDLRGYLGLGPDDRTRLAGRLQLGTVAGGAITDLPPDFLLYSGGGGTVRGQDFRGLGATQNGQDSGGRSFVGFSGELRQDITDTIGAVAFYDAGYIAADPLWDDSGTWHSGAGIGLRYETTVGAIRLDLAAPVSGPDPDNDLYFYIGIGQSF